MEALKAIYQRAVANGIEVSLINEKELAEIEPTARTTEYAIYSPHTASFYHLGICRCLYNELRSNGVNFSFTTKFVSLLNQNSIQTNIGIIEYETLINCAGMYADKIAQQFGLVENFTLIPFKGIFLYAEDLIGNYSRHIYPIPDQKIKLLGVHFSPEYDGRIKIGPTAVPCLARENYSWLSNLRFNEMKEIITTELRLFAGNTCNFRDLTISEMQKQTKAGLIRYATHLVKDIKQFRFTHWGTPGIQPRLYDIQKQEIVDDFLVQKIDNSVHVINSVSPAFTASFAFSEHIVETYLSG